ncbi:MAG: hypothetical protein JSS56_07875 [Proteobacteria bacterium]|nr:hypothetical protein [Pseudomonadota bacterium]
MTDSADLVRDRAAEFRLSKTLRDTTASRYPRYLPTLCWPPHDTPQSEGSEAVKFNTTGSAGATQRTSQLTIQVKDEASP